MAAIHPEEMQGFNTSPGVESGKLFADGQIYTLEAKSLSHAVTVKKQPKTILHNVSVKFCSGELVAVMGPSGAGKTTLLSVLGGNKPVKEGSLLLSGSQISRRYSKLCCFIPQDDILYPALTARQTFMYTALLRLPKRMKKSEKVQIVGKLIDDLKLSKCADTPVGDSTNRGISGGERKRVSIGMELVVNPAILFVDEPSSGLDSKVAEDVVALLRNLADTNRLVICTIHQPSWKVFAKFHKLLLLHNGRVVYCGGGDKFVVNYFASINFKPEDFENPLDFYMRALQEKDKTESDTFFADKWSSQDQLSKEKYQTIGDKEIVKPLDEGALKAMTTKNSYVHQFRMLFARIAYDTLRDQKKFVQGLALKLSIGVLMGIVFLNQAKSEKVESYISVSGMLFFMIMSSFIDTLFKTVLDFPLIRVLIAREWKNGAYDYFPYFCAQILVNNIFDMLSSFMYMPAYFMVGLAPQFAKIMTFLTVLLMNTLIGSSLGLALGAVAKDVQQAQEYLMPIMLPLMIFSGFLIPYDDIQSYFKWLYHISPFQYGISICIANEYADREFTEFRGLPGNYSGELVLDLSGTDKEDVPRLFGLLAAIALVSNMYACVSCYRALQKLAKLS